MPYRDRSSPAAKESAKKANKKHYENNKMDYYRRNKEKKKQMSEYLKKIKDVPCMDCNVKYPSYVMDLDHRDPLEKVSEINRLIANGSWTKFLTEIDKCDIVCSNCHRIRTHSK